MGSTKKKKNNQGRGPPILLVKITIPMMMSTIGKPLIERRSP
jgi:hypothetical protein